MKTCTVKDFYEWACANHCENYEFGYFWEIGPFCPYEKDNFEQDFKIDEKKKRVIFYC